MKKCFQGYLKEFYRKHSIYHGTDASGHVSMEVISIIFVFVNECVFIITY